MSFFREKFTALMMVDPAGPQVHFRLEIVQFKEGAKVSRRATWFPDSSKSESETERKNYAFEELRDLLLQMVDEVLTEAKKQEIGL